MDGKTLIHPSQVAPCNEIFSPTEEEVAWARKIIAAFEEPTNAHKGVISWKAEWWSGCISSWHAGRWPSPRPSTPMRASRRSGSRSVGFCGHLIVVPDLLPGSNKVAPSRTAGILKKSRARYGACGASRQSSLFLTIRLQAREDGNR